MFRLSQTALVFICLAVFSVPAVIADTTIRPSISIIIDDIGYRMQDDLRAIALPGAVAFAIMPHSPHARRMSALVNARGKDVLLHLPMQAMEQEKNRFLGPGALTMKMNRQELIRTLDNSLRSVPHAIGVNNHMGSLLTRQTGHMSWLMESLKSRNIFYIDSVTSKHSVAGTVANERNVPFLRRDVFLDNIQTEVEILKQFDRLIDIAKRNGIAVAIGHPHPHTIAVLTKKLALLKHSGVELVSPKQMLKQNRDKHNYQRVSLGKLIYE
jgi:polysaccharide deacetylase 2 family uncharacterized protein YibQ